MSPALLALLALLAQATPTATAAPAGSDPYAFVLALVATPAVGNLLAALATLVSAAAAYLVWRTRRDLKETEATLHRRVDRLAATRTRVDDP